MRYVEGEQVDVWCGFSGRWLHGYQVATVDPDLDEVILRRTDDGVVLDRWFHTNDIRLQHAHHLLQGRTLYR